MLGIKYRYEIQDDSKIKLAPAKGVWAFTIAATALLVVLPGLIIKGIEKIEERRELREKAKHRHPSSR